MLRKTLEEKDISDAQSLYILKDPEQNDYKSLIKKLAYQSKTTHKDELINTFKELSYLTIKMGDGEIDPYLESINDLTNLDSGFKETTFLSSPQADKIYNSIHGYLAHISPLKYYTDAAILHQYMNAMPRHDVMYSEVSNGLKIQFKILSFIKYKYTAVICDERKQAIAHKNTLANLRVKTKQDIASLEYIKEIDDQQYIVGVENKFKDISTEMKQFLAGLYQKAEKEINTLLNLEESPCEYAVIGLGSMALNQMTPYSDLEFALITENNAYKDNPKTLDYFRNLSHLVHLKVIYLGESQLFRSSDNIDLRHIIQVGVRFDSGGKTPLGRIEGDKPYDLIATQEELLWYVKNEGSKAEHIDKNLPYILENVTYVSGKPALVNQYQDAITAFLQESYTGEEKKYIGMLNYQVRALKVLQEGAVEHDYSPGINEPLIIQMPGDLQKLQPYLLEKAGRLFEVKQEIYRLPDRMIYNLGMCFGIKGDSAWHTIDSLKEKGIINQEAVINLKQAVNFATMLRLKTYSHYGYQKEKFSPKESDKLDMSTVIFCLTKENIAEDGELFQFFYSMLALTETLQKYCNHGQSWNQAEKEQFFANESFFANDAKHKAGVHHRLMNYEEYIKWEVQHFNELKKQYDNKPHHDMVSSLNNIGRIYRNLGNHEQSLKYHLDSLEMMTETLTITQPDIATSLNNIGTYSNSGNHNQSLKHHLDSLEMMKTNRSSIHPHTATLLNNIATSLNNIGCTYFELGEHKKALEYHIDSLKIMEATLPAMHPDTATSLNNIGCTYGNLGNHDKALQYKLKSLEMRKKILPATHPDIATSLNNIGCTYGTLGDNKQAMKHLVDSLEMKEKILPETHLDIATSLNNIGITYGKLGNHVQALKHHLNSLVILKAKLLATHPNIAASLNSIGITYDKLGDHEQALKYQVESLEMRKKILPAIHLDIATSLNNIGITHGNLGNHGQALQHHLDSLEMLKEIPLATNSYVAHALNNISRTYGKLGDHEQASIYLKMWKATQVSEEEDKSSVDTNSAAVAVLDIGEAVQLAGENDANGLDVYV